MSSHVHVVFFFSSSRRHTRCGRNWSSDVCSSDLSKAVPYGMPMDWTVSYRPGSRFGPNKIREVSIGLEEYSPYLDRELDEVDRKSTRLNSSHVRISYAVFCLKKKKKK